MPIMRVVQKLQSRFYIIFIKPDVFNWSALFIHGKNYFNAHHSYEKSKNEQIISEKSYTVKIKHTIKNWSRILAWETKCEKTSKKWGLHLGLFFLKYILRNTKKDEVEIYIVTCEMNVTRCFSSVLPQYLTFYFFIFYFFYLFLSTYVLVGSTRKGIFFF